MTRRKVLLIEDESSISDPLAATMEREGLDTTVCTTATEGLETFKSARPDVVVLDIMLPDGDGRDVLREIRAESRVPVVMLTARDSELDKVVGLELGADDYVTKPFSSAELIARLRAVIRRSDGEGATEVSELKVADVVMDLATRTVTHDGRPVEVTLREFDLLQMLMDNAGRVVTRSTLMDEVWDPNWWGSTKTLDIHISSLRKKLSDSAATPRYIHTVRGVGFRFSAPDEVAAGEGGTG